MHLKQSDLPYRAEVDGLRAVAIVSVILYHAQLLIQGKNWFEGGYLGVDVFFVLSGYLIARIILKELREKGSFSFLKFYEKRARRILPILFFVVIVTTSYAWHRLIPTSFIEYAESVLASLFFGSNFYFYFSTIEYGTDSALLKPFLHTWSLGVEEQFYLVFPVLASIIFKFFRHHFLFIVIILSIFSLLVAEYMSIKHSDLNFYLPVSRFWELATGSILAYRELTYKPKRSPFFCQTLPVLGLGLIIYSILIFNENTQHPGFITIIPILGVALIITYSSKNDLVGKILGSKPFVSVGLISYSAYMWHFPIFAFSRLQSSELSNFDKIELICLTLILSIASYFIIERPFRRFISLKAFLILLISTSLIIITGASYVIHTKGVPSNARLGFTANIVKTITRPSKHFAKNGTNTCGESEVTLRGLNWCQLGNLNRTQIDFIVIGDSHSRISTDLLGNIGITHNLKGLYFGTNGCPALLGVYPVRPNGQHPNAQSLSCYEHNSAAFMLAKELNISNVILISRWDYYVDGSDSGSWNEITNKSLTIVDKDETRKIYSDAVANTVKQYSEIPTRLTALLQVPHQDIDVRRIIEELLSISHAAEKKKVFLDAKKNFISVKDHSIRQALANDAWLQQAKNFDESDLLIIDPVDVYCTNTDCPIYDEEKSFYIDKGHLSTSGFAKLKKYFNSVLIPKNDDVQSPDL